MPKKQKKTQDNQVIDDSAQSSIKTKGRSCCKLIFIQAMIIFMVACRVVIVSGYRDFVMAGVKSLLEMEDPYAILKASPRTPIKELHKFWRREMVANHPEKNPGDEAARERFLEINAAYDAIKKPENKQFYDAMYYIMKYVRIGRKCATIIGYPSAVVVKRIGYEWGKDSHNILIIEAIYAFIALELLFCLYTMLPSSVQNLLSMGMILIWLPYKLFRKMTHVCMAIIKSCIFIW